MKKIITISREFGAGGGEIGKEVARRLGYEYYDKAIILRAAKEANIDVESGFRWDESVPVNFGFAQSLFDFYNKPLNEKLFEAQKQVIRKIGEKSYESYKRFREAGADRYLLRHETANDVHYRKLHPEEMSLAVRKQCLYDLKALGYQVGAGFMVGSPEQTAETLADDLVFLKELDPQMVGIGPFIPHHDTMFADEPSGSVPLTLFLLSVIRIMLPHVLLPATTALGTADPLGREKGLQHGANVVMPNLSPVKNRKQYDLYDNKICTGEEAAECRGCLGRRVESVGFELVSDRGDFR